MDRQSPALAVDILSVALALGDDPVLALELRSGLAEGFLGSKLPGAGLAPQFQIPVFGEVLGLARLFSLVETRRFLPAR
jgi:hypothetical protein